MTHDHLFIDSRYVLLTALLHAVHKRKNLVACVMLCLAILTLVSSTYTVLRHLSHTVVSLSAINHLAGVIGLNNSIDTLIGRLMFADSKYSNRFIAA
jgi:uncharacterized SAM-binding protein YcdF (DUF218 family)